MPFTAPNHYAPREDWAQRLKMIGPAVGSWQFDMVVYWQWRATQHRDLEECWTSLRMTPDNAKKALMTVDPRPTNDAGLIPPEIFSRLLARSQAASIDPDDDVSPVVIDPPVPVIM